MGGDDPSTLAQATGSDMTVLLVLAGVVTFFRLLNYVTATPRARVVPVSVRLVEARRIAAGEPTHLASLECGSVEWR
jgi:hypothetical protein